MSSIVSAQPLPSDSLPSESTEQAIPASTAWLVTLRTVWIGAVLLSGGLMMGMNLADADLWGHALYGKEWIETGRLAPTTTHSFTSNGFRWVNHENLTELLTAWTEMRFGPQGLLIGKFLLSQVVLGLVLFQARRKGVGLFLAGGCALLAASGLAFHWHFRPQLLGYTFFTGMIVGLSWIFEGWEGRNNYRPWSATALPLEMGAEYRWGRMRCLWLAFPLFAIWTNAHGSFAAGIAVFGAYLVFRACEAVLLWGRGSAGRIRRLALMCCLALLATCATPYGLELHSWMFAAIGHPQPEIMDWQPIALLSGDAMPFWALVAATAFSLKFTKLPKDITQCLILGLVAWQSVSHIRHLTFLAILVALWIPPHLASAVDRLFEKPEGTVTHPWPRSVIQLAIALLVVWIGNVGMQLAPRLTQLQVDRTRFPVSAMQFVEDHQLRGRSLVMFNWAQYALACFDLEKDPLVRSTVAIDGRYTTCYSPEVIDIHFDFMLGPHYTGGRHRSSKSGPIDPERALKLGSPEICLICRTQKSSVRALEANPDEWALLYQDSYAQVWGLRSRFDNPESQDFLPPEQRRIGEEIQIGTVPYPALPIQHRL